MQKSFKYFWFEYEDEGLKDVVVEALDWEKAYDLFCLPYGLDKPTLAAHWHEVDMPILESSGIRFNLIMADGVGITIND